MRAHIDAIRALIPSTFTTYFVDVPTAPTYPYVLIWSSAGTPGMEQALTDERTDIDTQIGATMAAGTPEGVLIVQSAVRAVLMPGGKPKSLTVPGRVAVLRLEDSRPIAVDRDVTIPTTNRFPAYGVDLYRLISTPA